MRFHCTKRFAGFFLVFVLIFTFAFNFRQVSTTRASSRSLSDLSPLFEIPATDLAALITQTESD
jgi:hypothetical protein